MPLHVKRNSGWTFCGRRNKGTKRIVQLSKFRKKVAKDKIAQNDVCPSCRASWIKYMIGEIVA